MGAAGVTGSTSPSASKATLPGAAIATRTTVWVPALTVARCARVRAASKATGTGRPGVAAVRGWGPWPARRRAFLLPSAVLPDDEAISAAAEQIVHVFEDAFVLGGLALEVEASVGVAVYPEHGNRVDFCSTTPTRRCTPPRRSSAASSRSA